MIFRLSTLIGTLVLIVLDLNFRGVLLYSIDRTFLFVCSKTKINNV